MFIRAIRGKTYTAPSLTFTMNNPNLRPLDKDLRGKLENAVKAARKIAEEAARAACEQLGVARVKPDDHLSEDEKDPVRS